MQWMARPTRFPLELPVCYRDASGGEWRSGTTLDVSTNGVVLRMAPEFTGVPTALVLVIRLPFEDGCLVGTGRIARSVAARPEIGTTDVAVAVSEFQIVHRPSVAAATDGLSQHEAPC